MFGVNINNIAEPIMDQPNPEEEEGEEPQPKGNSLTLWGNAKTMNMNNIVVTNVLSSPYFKNHLFKLKTYHEIIDEIYYKVEHLEPWEKGSRKTHGQVGMCGGVRGVGAGGIVSSAYCLLFKLFTLKLTEKQLLGLCNYYEHPYIRGLGFLFIRYCIDPKLYWYWFETYLEDEEEIDPKAGGGAPMTIGMFVRSLILRLDWYGTLFPRIPVPVHKDLEKKLTERGLCNDRERYAGESADAEKKREEEAEERRKERERERAEKDEKRKAESSRSKESSKDSRDRSRDRKPGSRDRSRDRRPGSRDKDRRPRSRDRDRRPSSRDRDRRPGSRDRDRKRDSRDKDHRRDDKRRRSRSPKRRDRSR